MAVEKLSSVIVIHLINIDSDQGEADVDNDEDEEEHEDINNHVRHGDYDRARLSPHQSSLE